MSLYKKFFHLKRAASRHIRIHYYLLRMTTKNEITYHLCVHFGHDFSQIRIGTDLAVALQFYNTVVRCQVTPCTLTDIATDIGINPYIPINDTGSIISAPFATILKKNYSFCQNSTKKLI